MFLKTQKKVFETFVKKKLIQRLYNTQKDPFMVNPTFLRNPPLCLFNIKGLKVVQDIKGWISSYMLLKGNAVLRCIFAVFSEFYAIKMRRFQATVFYELRVLRMKSLLEEHKQMKLE